MKKRVLAGILMLVMVMASVMGVSAGPSKEGKIYVTQSQEGYYMVREGADEYKDLKAASATMYDLVTGYNAGKVTLDKMLENAPADVKEAVKGKEVVWKVFDLIPVNGGKPNNEGKHEVTVEVPMLTSAMKDVVVIHYSEARNVWEKIEPKSVDYTKKTITAVYDDLSPVGIFVKNTGGSASGTSPSTEGVSSAWMIWSAAALIVLGAGVVVSQKKRYQ